MWNYCNKEFLDFVWHAFWFTRCPYSQDDKHTIFLYFLRKKQSCFFSIKSFHSLGPKTLVFCDIRLQNLWHRARYWDLLKPSIVLSSQVAFQSVEYNQQGSIFFTHQVFLVFFYLFEYLCLSELFIFPWYFCFLIYHWMVIIFYQLSQFLWSHVLI